jgi:hypothetical protein
MTSSRASSTRPMSGKHEDRAHGGAGTRPVTSTDARTSDFVYPRGGEVIGEHRIEVFTGIECTPTVKRRCDVGRTSSAHNPLQYLAFRIAATNDVERGIRLHGCRHTRDPMHEHGRSGAPPTGIDTTPVATDVRWSRKVGGVRRIASHISLQRVSY